MIHLKSPYDSHLGLISCTKAGLCYPPDSDFFQLPQKVEKAMTPRILDSQEIKSDFNSKMLSIDRGFTNY